MAALIFLVLVGLCECIFSMHIERYEDALCLLFFQLTPLELLKETKTSSSSHFFKDFQDLLLGLVSLLSRISFMPCLSSIFSNINILHC